MLPVEQEGHLPKPKDWAEGKGDHENTEVLVVPRHHPLKL